MRRLDPFLIMVLLLSGGAVSAAPAEAGDTAAMSAIATETPSVTRTPALDLPGAPPGAVILQAPPPLASTATATRSATPVDPERAKKAVETSTPTPGLEAGAEPDGRRSKDAVLVPVLDAVPPSPPSGLVVPPTETPVSIRTPGGRAVKKKKVRTPTLTPTPVKPVVRIGIGGGLYDTGLIQSLIPGFEKTLDAYLELQPGGVWENFQLFKQGKFTVLLTNWEPVVKEAMTQGWTVKVDRILSNPYLLVGPREDPAKIKGIPETIRALKKISLIQAPYIIRSDRSANHLLAEELWSASGAKVHPTWFVKSRGGMKDALALAWKKKAYLIVDRANFVAWKHRMSYVVYVEGDQVLASAWTALTANPYKHPALPTELGVVFCNSFGNPSIQARIFEFGRKKYQVPMFLPVKVHVPGVDDAPSEGQE